MNSVSSPAFSSLQEGLSGLAGSGRQAFLHSLSQHARLISIETPLEPGALIVQSFTGREAMSELFRFEVDCLATSAHYELKKLTGEEVSLRLQLPDGSTRSFHGIVIASAQLGGDGSLARYRLTLAPWLHALTLRRDSYVFQDKTVLDIIEEVFKDYPVASYRFDVKATLPKRSLTTQYRETDYDFIARLLAEEGLNFFIQHDDSRAHQSPASGPTAADARTAHAHHCFVVFDANETLAACPRPEVRIHRADATETEDAITLFAARRQVSANTVALGSWDYKALAAHASEGHAALKTNDVPPLEIHEGSGAYRYADADESRRIAQARAESLALQSQTMSGESSVRSFAIGAWFELLGAAGDMPAPASQDREYIVLSLEHRGSNNLTVNETSLLASDRIEAGTYRNHFTCAPRATPVRPPYWLPKPTAPGAQVALIVGVDNEEITTERDHRVKVQFPWQRGERSAAGQLTHPSTSNAAGNETSGTWVRVAELAAGANWGSHFIPRIGQEVLIDFIAGDIDRPVVTGQMYNGVDKPSFHGADNHSGAMTGIRSKEHAGSGFNHWVIDDTPGQLRQSIGSSYGTSQLNVGYLIRQTGNVRGAYRGRGLELTTDAWSTLRAKRGLFISTAQRNGAASTQLDTQEAQGKLKAAGELAKTLSDASAQHQALPLSTPDRIQQLVDTIGGTVDGAPEFTQPVALLDSQAGVNSVTPASMVALAGQDITLTAAAAMRMSAGQAASVSVARSTSLFTHAGGAKVIAAKEPVSLQAHTGPMDVLADQAITVTSSNTNIRIQAKQEILLSSGGGYIKLAGSNIDIHCPAAVSVKGLTHDFLGAGSVMAALPTLPEETLRLAPTEIDIEHLYHDDEGVQGAKYELRLSDGSKRTGATNGAGQLHLSDVPTGAAHIRFTPDMRKYEIKAATENPDHMSNLSDADIDRLIQKYRGNA